MCLSLFHSPYAGELSGVRAFGGESMNILFLAVSAGGGHLQAAEAVKEYIETNYQESKLRIIDAYKYVSPIINKLVIGGYLKTLKNSPKLWGKLYEMAEKGENVSDLSKTLNKILSFKIKRLIRELNPDVVICTHPFPLQMACNLKKKGEIKVPIVNIITDYATHTFWVNEYVDAYIVANESLVGEMENRGVRREIVYPLGIPVRNKFITKKDKNEVLNKYRLEDKPTFLLMGGSLGIGEIKTLFSNLLKSYRDFQLVIVCGKNIKLKKQLERIYLKSMSSKRILILGFTEKIDELMTISDLIITKPGGLTITESLIMKLPIAIITPIPGQEERNAHFLLNNGVGIRVTHAEDIEKTIYQLFENPLRVRHIKEMSEYLSKPNSTKNLVELLFSLTRNN